MNSKITGVSKKIIHYYDDKINKVGEHYAIIVYCLTVDQYVFGLKSKELFINEASPYFALFETAITTYINDDDNTFVNDLKGLSVDLFYNGFGRLDRIGFSSDAPHWILSYIDENVVDDVDSEFSVLN